MFSSLRKITKAAIADYECKPRHEWATQHPSQVVLAVSQIMWCRDLTEALQGEENVLDDVKACEQKCFMNLNNLAELVRGVLPKLVRNIIGALITLDVHARDIVSTMVTNEVRMGRMGGNERRVRLGRSWHTWEGINKLGMALADLEEMRRWGEEWEVLICRGIA